ncbi:MAG TPA: long-chain fatty acid--CoA ligase [Candidatus Avacidaminococcus intestinavium]|uniref:Long-chain fatty acid--CoA ligase n=1 Tax=Candidatus Avacidaminococcus intestinavium TaxID=2840684 RepID=A0A9D1SLZ7_9FIRM|nr:long-chain fatty acid--CoA ligase [Candidatus Avacidaminococcus intestinavium]
MLYYEIIERHPAADKALIFKEEEITYGQLREKIKQYAAYLQSCGLQKGDRVGLLSKNSADFVVTYFAVIRAGGIVVPFNFQLAAREIAYIVKDADLKLMVVRESIDLKTALEEIGYPTLRQVTFAELQTGKPAELLEYKMQQEENCTIIYTSGTTGKPKGAMLSHTNLVANAEEFTAVVDVYPTDIGLCVLPMYHCFAWTVSVTGMLLKGAAIVVQETYIFKDTMNLIAKHQVNAFAGVPTMIQLFYKGAEKEELANIRWFVSGGAPLPQVLAAGFQKKFGKPVQEGYGLSEASPVVAVNPASKVKVGSIGPELPGVTVSIRTESDQELPAGEVGELCVRGKNVMLGYLNLPEETAKALRGGWLHTGDLAYKDEEGYIFIVDRLKDMIISSGENIYPREIEEVLYTHPLIEEVSVIGIPDKLRGQAVCAYIVLREGEGLERKAVRKYLLERLAPYKVPREFFFCAQLPKNSTGKILKTALREQALIDMVNRKR